MISVQKNVAKRKRKLGKHYRARVKIMKLRKAARKKLKRQR